MKRQLKLAVLWSARALGVFAMCRYLTRAQPRILCYHGGCIGDESRFNPKLFIRTVTFASRMRWLQTTGFTIVTLDALSDAVRKKQAQPRLATALTFDDGWHSTASELLPVLQRMGFPSTLYLCTEHYQEQWPVAAVVLRYMFWKMPVKQVRIDQFHPDVDGTHDLAKPGVADYLAGAVRAAILSRAHTEAAVCAELARLGAMLGIAPTELALAQRRFAYMTPAMLVQVPATGCRIELHGHVHQYPAGDAARFEADLQQCAAIIERAGLPTPRHYCYPSGNYDAGASKVLARLGVVTATTCEPALVNAAAPGQLHYLPRFLDGEDVDRLEFEAEMSGVTSFLRRFRGASGKQAYGL